METSQFLSILRKFFLVVETTQFFAFPWCLLIDVDWFISISVERNLAVRWVFHTGGLWNWCAIAFRCTAPCVGATTCQRPRINDMEWWELDYRFTILSNHNWLVVWNMKFIFHTSSTAQNGCGSFKNRKPIGEVGCCESGMAERIHWWTERCLRSPLFRSLSLTIYLPTYLSSMYLSIYRSLSLSFICLSV